MSIIKGGHVIAGAPVASSLDIPITLEAASWSNNTQTVNNVNIIATGCRYFISPSSISRSAYIQADIYADDVSTNGSMTFHCSSTPATDISVYVVRTGVS